LKQMRLSLKSNVRRRTECRNDLRVKAKYRFLGSTVSGLKFGARNSKLNVLLANLLKFNHDSFSYYCNTGKVKQIFQDFYSCSCTTKEG